MTAALVREARYERFPSPRSTRSPTRPFAGNPAAVMPLDAWLDDAVLQAIAAGEQPVARPPSSSPDASGEADFELRWFTPAAEVALCGHATLASGHFVLSSRSGARPGALPHAPGGRARGRARTATAMRWRCRPGRRSPGRCPRSSPRSASTRGRDAVARQGLCAGRRRATRRRCARSRPTCARSRRSGRSSHIVAAPGDDTDVVSRVFAPAISTSTRIR